MSLIEVARDALKDIPISEVLRERVSLALDQLADAQRQVEVLQTEKGSLGAKLERECLDHEQTKKELNKLRELHIEKVMLLRGIEFRRGERTSRAWTPFCPKCHMPVSFMCDEKSDPVTCSDRSCTWKSDVSVETVQNDVRHMAQQG
jgi:hypothetical protein